MPDHVSYATRDDVAVITMDDGKANALDHATLDALSSALDRAEAEAKAVLLVGREGKFCAGFDLKTMMSGIEAAKELVGKGGPLFLRLYELPLPVVAACTGHALAGGAIVLLACDTRIGAAGAFKIGLNEVSISLPLPVLGQELARDRIDNRHLTEATVQAKIYGPDDAARVGFLDRVTSAEALFEEALAETKRLARLPTDAYATTKRKLRSATIQRIRDTFDSELAAAG